MRRSSTQKVQRKIAQHHYVFRKFWDADFRSHILPLLRITARILENYFCSIMQYRLPLVLENRTEFFAGGGGDK